MFKAAIAEGRIPGAALLVLACVLTAGCAESCFPLSPDSRLPVWITLPPGMSRQDVDLEIWYYIVGRPNGQADFILKTKDGKVLSKITGDVLNEKPLTPGCMKDCPSLYPSYEIVRVNGVTELIEDRGDGYFYVSDDPDLRKGFGVPQVSNTWRLR